MDKLNTRQAADDRRPAVRGPRRPDLPRLHRASPLRTARLLARGVGPAQGLPAAGFSHEDATALCPALSTRPPGRTGRNRQGVSGCGREEATAVGLPRTPRTPPGGADTGETSWRPYSAAPGGWVYPPTHPAATFTHNYQPGDEWLEHPTEPARTPAAGATASRRRHRDGWCLLVTPGGDRGRTTDVGVFERRRVDFRCEGASHYVLGRPLIEQLRQPRFSLRCEHRLDVVAEWFQGVLAHLRVVFGCWTDEYSQDSEVTQGFLTGDSAQKGHIDSIAPLNALHTLSTRLSLIHI